MFGWHWHCLIWFLITYFVFLLSWGLDTLFIYVTYKPIVVFTDRFVCHLPMGHVACLYRFKFLALALIVVIFKHLYKTV